VLTKGEAEAKALAMRADAYKQFNEAAIIQTVLAALPEIVRAAAEPMGHIDSLTVMSADGASDIVKNATRAMIESTTAIRGLTGLDVPGLIGGALGRGFSERLRSGDGEGVGNGESGSAAERISQIAGGGLSALKKGAADAADAEHAGVHEAEAKGEAAADRASAAVTKATAAVDKAAADAKAAVDKAAAQAKAVVTEKTGQGAAGWSAVPQVKPGETESSTTQWTKWLADQLRRVPDIGVYSALRLSDLSNRGPASARGIWTTAKDVLEKDYGSVTIGELLNRS
jgi:hypothetical protein